MQVRGPQRADRLTWVVPLVEHPRRTIGPVQGVVLAVAAGVGVASFAGAKLAFPVHVTSDSMAPWVRAGDYGRRLLERGGAR